VNPDAEPWGIAVYKRQGNALQNTFPGQDEYYLPTAEQVLAYLKENEIKKIYTGDISHGKPFLGIITRSFIVDENEHKTGTLEEQEMGVLTCGGIEVITLDELL